MSALIGVSHRPLVAAVILLGGIISVASMDALAKILSAYSVPIMQINWGRFFFHFLFLIPFLFFLRRRLPLVGWAKQQRPYLWLHVLRGVLLATSSFAFFFAISTNPLPDSLAIFFIEPLIVMIYARLFIGEAFNRHLLVAAAVGLIGVLVILRPGVEGTGYDWRILFALLAALCFAGYIVSARHVAGHTPALITSWTTALFGAIPISLLLPFFWQLPTLQIGLMMAGVGMLSALGHTLIILAVRYATASYVAVLHYVEVPVAALISLIIFAHYPDQWVWVGITMIACANYYAVRMQR